jgi:hypothetical protein
MNQWSKDIYYSILYIVCSLPYTVKLMCYDCLVHSSRLKEMGMNYDVRQFLLLNDVRQFLLLNDVQQFLLLNDGFTRTISKSRNAQRLTLPPQT